MYSYCTNNPLIYTDPSGYLLDAESWNRSMYDSRLRRGGNSQTDIWLIESDINWDGYFDTPYSTSSIAGNGYFRFYTAVNGEPPGNPKRFTNGYWVKEYGNSVYYIRNPLDFNEVGEISEVIVCERFVPYLINSVAPSGGGGSGIFDGLGFLSGITSNGANIRANNIYNSKGWRNNSGRHFSSDLLKKGANGRYVRGVQGYRNSANLARNTAQSVRMMGNTAGALGGAVIVADVLVNSEITVSNGINAFMTGISFTGIGAPIAGVWFVADFGMEIFTGRSFSERIDANTPSLDWNW